MKKKRKKANIRLSHSKKERNNLHKYFLLVMFDERSHENKTQCSYFFFLREKKKAGIIDPYINVIHVYAYVRDNCIFQRKNEIATKYKHVRGKYKYSLTFSFHRCIYMQSISFHSKCVEREVKQNIYSKRILKRHRHQSVISKFQKIYQKFYF